MTKLSDYQKTIITAKDQLTGFTGKITGHADYITGCDQYLIQPDAKEGEWKEARWFDEGRLEVIVSAGQALEVADLQAEKNGADSPAPIK
jgi:hypothetical protein